MSIFKFLASKIAAEVVESVAEVLVKTIQDALSDKEVKSVVTPPVQKEAPKKEGDANVK